MKTHSKQGRKHLSSASELCFWLACAFIPALFTGCDPKLENKDAESPDPPILKKQGPPELSSLSHQAETAPAMNFKFVDVSAESGLNFANVSGSMAQSYVLESMAAGAAFLDYDGDGFQDLFVVNGTRLKGAPEAAKNRLFHNEPGKEFSGRETRIFREVDADMGAGEWGMGCAAGDYDNDGDVDLYVTYWGPNHSTETTGTDIFPRSQKKLG